MAKKKQIRNVLCFLVMIVILMSVMSVSAFAVNDGDNSSGDCAPVPDADLPEIYLNDTQECVLSSDSSNDTNIIILADISDDTRETVSALGCDVYVKIDDPCCKGYKVYVDGVYQFTEGQGKTPDGYCAFDVSAGKHTLKITKNGRSASKTNYFQCGNTYRWVSMPYCWCENGGSDDCKNPPTVKFDKTKYYEGDTVHATVSTSQSSVYYKIKDCGGTVRKSGTTSNGKKIAYTIPKGASKCCYWQICFYWNEGDDLASGMSYDCTKCYKFYVCPKTTCDVYVKIDDPCCVGYKLYVDGKYLFTEGGDGTTPDGYCAFDVSAGKHTLKITKNGRSASKTIYFECNIVYRWVSMPKNWCGDGEAYVEIKDKYCKGYKVYVDDVYQFTEGQSGTPNGNCAFHVTDGTHTLKITKNGRSASITKYFECGATYHWVSMPDNWCNPCADPPTATFDKQKYNEGDTMHATVSTSSGSVNYKIKDCGGNIRKSGDISNGGMISYTIPTGASECCNWQICFYWGKGGSDIGPLDAGGKLTAQSYECTKCYDFYVCPGEKPAPEIIKVEYPTTCVKEGEDATISVTVKNNGGASSEGYISVSFPNDEQIYDVSGTGGTYNKLYPKGSRIWNNKDQQMESVDPLVELLDTNWGKGQQETITMNVKPDSGSDEIVFYVRAALKNADGTYERDPTYSGYTDQQGWYVKNYAIGVCPKEACVIIDDDTCVGYKVYVDGAYQLTEGVGETLDGYCTFYVAGGTNTVEIRDNECFASITRNFERGSTYRWDSMPKNWCKCNAAVKFRGVIIKETHPISFYNCKIKIDEILMDPSGVLDSGDEIWIWAFGTGPAQVDVVSIGDTVEVYGKYDGEPQRQVKLETGEHYLKNLEKQEIKFNGTATDYFERIGAGGWNVTVDEIISGPSELEGHTVSVALWSVNPEEYPPGYIEDTIEPGDSVKVYGLYAGEDAVTLSGSKDYYLTKDYETEEGYKWITIGEVTTFDCCDTKDYFEVSTHADWLTECLKIKASTGECLQGHGFVSWGPDSDCWKTGCLMEDLTFLDASKGMIELWTQEWDPNRGAGGAYSGAVKVRYRITCYDPPKNKLDRKAWIPAAVDTVRLGFGEKDFWVYISGVKSESPHTTLFLWGGAEPGYPRTPASYEDKIDVGDVKEGDSFELEVPSGKINLKILQFVWGEPDWPYLEKVRVEYKMTSAPTPKLTITGGYSDYKPPLQVFFQGSEVHVSVQNPSEYTYIVEYWNDTNDNLEVDDNEWQRLPADIISTTTKSDSEFDIPLPDLMPLGLYRVTIEGTDYVSNDFFVIFNPLNCGLTDEEIDKYWWSNESGCRACSHITGTYKYRLCYSVSWVKNLFFGEIPPTEIKNHENEMLLIMAANWDYYSNQYAYLLGQLCTFVDDNMNFIEGLKPPSDIADYINRIKSGAIPIDGDCDCHAVFLVALARTSGIPARVVYGLGNEGHAWVEVFYDGTWQLWDPSLDNPAYGSSYETYSEDIIFSDLGCLYFVLDEYHVDRSPDYVTSSRAVTGVLEEGPTNLHAYNYQGRHVGVSATGGAYELEIPSAYYNGPDYDPERIVILDQSEDVLFQIAALDTGKFNFTLIQIKPTTIYPAKITTVTYLDIPITKTTEATVHVSEEKNPDFLMVIKDYDDGSEITKAPDSIETKEKP